MAHGGKRSGAGRKTRADEQELIEKLSPLEKKAYKALDEAITRGKDWAIKMWFEYTYGKPKQTIDQNNTHNITDFDIKKLYDKET